MAHDGVNMKDSASAGLRARSGSQDGLGMEGYYRIEARRNGELLWVEEGPNTIVDTGKTYAAGTALIGVAQIATWYLGLTDGTPTIAAGDTMASHAGWTEVTAYDEAARVAWSGAAGAAGVVTNTASPATFTINATTTVGGIFLASVNTKGGTTGTLFSVKEFSQARALVDNDELTVTYQVSAA